MSISFLQIFRGKTRLSYLVPSEKRGGASKGKLSAKHVLWPILILAAILLGIGIGIGIGICSLWYLGDSVWVIAEYYWAVYPRPAYEQEAHSPIAGSVIE